MKVTETKRGTVVELQWDEEKVLFQQHQVLLLQQIALESSFP